MELSGSSGAVASPMFPNSYSGTGLFSWRIVVNETYAVQISFIHYELDPFDDTNCEYYDRISVR